MIHFVSLSNTLIVSPVMQCNLSSLLWSLQPMSHDLFLVYHLKLIEKNGNWRIGVGHTFPNVKEFFDVLQTKAFEIKYLNQSKNSTAVMLQFFLERDLKAIESRKVPRPVSI